MTSITRFVAVLIVIVALAGCENGVEPEVGKVTGVVTIDGKPADEIGVAFIPVSTESSAVAPVATAVTDKSGRYELSYVVYSDDPNESPVRKPGATLGLNQVVLDDNRQKLEHLPTSRLAANYAQPELSGFQFEVKPGEQVYDLPLHSR